MDANRATTTRRKTDGRPARIHTTSGSASSASTIASQSEVKLVQRIEHIKGDIQSAVKTLALLAHYHSGPFAHQLAFETEWLRAVMTATNPNWHSDPKWATALTAFEYFESFRSGAEQLGEALQTTASTKP